MSSDYLGFDPEGEEVIDREEISHDAPSTNRSSARRLALQILYEVDTASHALGHVLSYQLNRIDQPRAVAKYTTTLVRGVVDNQARIDELLQAYAPDWPIDQVAVVDRNILRIAVYEMAIGNKAPVGVAIDEAIELAKLFGADNTPRFINGVLGAIADQLPEVKRFLALPVRDEMNDDSDTDTTDDDPTSDDIPNANNTPITDDAADSTTNTEA